MRPRRYSFKKNGLYTWLAGNKVLPESMITYSEIMISSGEYAFRITVPLREKYISRKYIPLMCRFGVLPDVSTNKLLISEIADGLIN